MFEGLFVLFATLAAFGLAFIATKVVKHVRDNYPDSKQKHKHV